MKSTSTLFRQLFLIVVLISAFSLSALAAVYEKVTTAPSDWSGQYLIVYETDKVAFDGSRTTLDAVSNTKSITISNNQISVDTDNFYFTIAKSGSNYTIKSASGYYIGQTSNANGLKSNTSTTYSNTLTINNDQSINFVSGGAYLRYNAASNQYRFRYYKSSSYTGQKAICLYKLVEEQGGGGETTATPLTAPTIKTATNITATGFTANWSKVDNAIGYKISIDGKTYDVKENVTSCDITGLKSEKEYQYTVTAVGDGTNYINSPSSEATVITKTIEVGNIAEFLDLKDTKNNVVITNPVTVVAQDKDQKRIWVQDNSGAIMIYSFSELNEYAAGQQFTNLKGKYTIYNGTTELVPAEDLPEPTKGTIPTPSDASLGDIVANMDTYMHKYVSIENATYSDSTITDGTNSLKIYDYFNVSLDGLEDQDIINVVGIVGKYGSNNQIYIISYEKFIPETPTIVTHSTTLNFGDIKTNNTKTTEFTIDLYHLTNDVTIECNNNNFEVTPTNISKSESTATIAVTFKAPTEVGTQTGTITISSDGAESKIVTLTANVYEAYTIKFGNIEKETNANGNVTDIPTHDGVVGWTTDSVFAIEDEKPNVIDENTIFEKNTKLYPVYTIIEGDSQEEAWTLVTDASTLAVGDEVVIAAANYNYALSINQKTSNRGATPITKENNTITVDENVQILTLEAGTTDGTFAFNTSSGYLYAASSSSNHLKTQTTNNANGSWTITITNGIASIVAKQSSYRNVMQYNPNNDSPLFACYESASQKAIALYKKTGGAITKYNIAGNKTVDNNTTFDVENNININTLTIKSNFDEAGEVNVTDGALSANKVIIEKTIDASRWFFFSLPFDCQIKDIVAIAANGNSLTYDTHYVISKYNPTREEGQKNAWEDLLITAKLNANQGYIIGHWYKQSDNIIVKFPSTNAQTITAPADKTLNYTDTWFVDGENSSKGFNLIGMPYYQNINSTISCDSINIYSTTPNKDGKTYTQEEYTGNNVAPFTSFFVQVAENTAPKFTISTKSSSAPMLRAKDVVAKATITLADANGGADETTIINNPTKTTDYEIGHDLVKWIGYAEIPQIYSLQGEEMLAFNSLAIDNSTVIPLGVYAHTDGGYTFRLSEKSIGDLEGWELYDNETGKTTRLAYEDFTIYLEQGTHEGRFEIRLQQRITTNCDNSMGDMMTWTANGTLNINNMPTDAVVYIYDAVGRMVHVATPNTNTFNYSFVARGVYNIVVRSADNTVSFKTIY